MVHEPVGGSGGPEVPKYVIERDVPGAGGLTAEQWQVSAADSNRVIRMLGPDIRWLHSYVTTDKIYCVYVAPDEEILLEHARCLGIPADRISEVAVVLDPSSSAVSHEEDTGPRVGGVCMSPPTRSPTMGE